MDYHLLPLVPSTLPDPPPQSGKLIISAYSGVTRRISAAWKILWYFTTICSAAVLLWYCKQLIEWYKQNPHWMSIPPHEQPGNSDKAGRSGNLIIMKKAGWSRNHISAVDYCNPGCGTGPLKESSLICVLFLNCSMFWQGLWWGDRWGPFPYLYFEVKNNDTMLPIPTLLIGYGD